MGAVQEEDVVFNTRAGAERYVDYLKKKLKDLHEKCEDLAIKELYRADFEIME